MNKFYYGTAATLIVIGSIGGGILYSNKKDPKMISKWNIIDVPGDGNCLFSSIAVSEYYNQYNTIPIYNDAIRNRAKELRYSANDFLCPNGSISSQEIDGLPIKYIVEPLGNESFNGYCKRMRNDYQWGTAAEILALSHQLKNMIHVYIIDNQTSEIKQIASYGDSYKSKPIHLLYVNSIHYKSLCPQQIQSKL